ncbi:MAG: PASTA domain-containing protein, partial [Bacillota bacterium]|nr:PASTA domain-containing protein [Bacillota bacterium]
DPTSDAQVKAGDNVTVVISLGAKVSLVKVPSVLGMSEAQAKSALESAGLLLGDVETIESEKPVGTVVEQKVPAGLEIDEKTGVDVVLSLGSKKPAETGNNGTGGNSGGTPQDPGDTGNNSGEKTVNQNIALKSSPEVQHVVVKLNDVTVYDQIKKASDKQITVPLTGSGSGYLKVYINDVLTYESVVPFN